MSRSPDDEADTHLPVGTDSGREAMARLARAVEGEVGQVGTQIQVVSQRFASLGISSEDVGRWLAAQCLSTAGYQFAQARAVASDDSNRPMTPEQARSSEGRKRLRESRALTKSAMSLAKLAHEVIAYEETKAGAVLDAPSDDEGDGESSTPVPEPRTELERRIAEKERELQESA